MQKTKNRCIKHVDYMFILSSSIKKLITLSFVHENRVYLYTTHDEDVIVNDFYTMNDWRCYSSSDMVNWTDHGSPLSYKGNSFTNHSGIIDFKGNSYLFYHNGSLPGGGSYHRSVCMEQFSYNTDGTISQLTMTTQGVTQVGSFNPYDTIQAETICWESGVETEICSGATGKHDLFLKFTGANSLLFNFNWWKFDQPHTSVERISSKKTAEKANSVLFKSANKIVLELNLPQYSQGNLEISLFDLKGRKVVSSFTDLTKSGSIDVPLNRNILRAGTYLISVKQNNKVLLQNSLVLKK